ncbi:unnamed protein product [Linum tenue]|uniref:Uncharacterized protein n=1 Tax=Linum tenue TaxID=586396 RepID=A0AAV0KNE2_9ROSI|nr:unnamed protein product [Linum tenue]
MVERVHMEEFQKWFAIQVAKMIDDNVATLHPSMLTLSREPDNGIPQIVEDTLKRLGVNLAESSMAGDKVVNDEDEYENGDEEVNDEDADGIDDENSSP